MPSHRIIPLLLAREFHFCSPANTRYLLCCLSLPAMLYLSRRMKPGGSIIRLWHSFSRATACSLTLQERRLVAGVLLLFLLGLAARWSQRMLVPAAEAPPPLSPMSAQNPTQEPTP